MPWTLDWSTWDTDSLWIKIEGCIRLELNNQHCGQDLFQFDKEDRRMSDLIPPFTKVTARDCPVASMLVCAVPYRVCYVAAVCCDVLVAWKMRLILFLLSSYLDTSTSTLYMIHAEKMKYQYWRFRCRISLKLKAS